MIDKKTHCEQDTKLPRLKRQYKRLLANYHNQQHEVQLKDIADILSCTPRYARTLLKEMNQSGWISWSSLPGRGKLSLIQCRLDSENLENVRSVTESEPVTYTPEHPALMIDGDNFILRHYHPLPAIVPKSSALYLSRHLIRMVHVGLVRYRRGNTDPELALAHHLEVSEDRKQWRFYLRRGLFWHNNEPFNVADCLHTFYPFIGTSLLPHVCEVDADKQSVVFHLTQPDEMLLYRLANPALAISHPAQPTVGLGPFMVVKHTDELIVLARFSHWFGKTPQAGIIRIETRLRKPTDWGLVNLSTDKTDSLSANRETLTSRDTFSFLAFNNTRRNALSRQQCFTLVNIAKNIVSGMIKKQPDIFAVEDWLAIADKTAKVVKLPATLALSYFSTPDTEIFVNLFSNNLLRLGCRLNARPIHYSHWPVTEEHWQNVDIALGYLSSMQEAAFTFEERWRRSNMVKVFWSSEMQTKILSLLKLSAMRDPACHMQFLIDLQRHAIRHKLMIPLYAKQYTLAYPRSVRGVHCHPQCWPDFTRLWIDASLEGQGS